MAWEEFPHSLDPERTYNAATERASEQIARCAKRAACDEWEGKFPK
jgi:hypothetical protein